MQKIISLVLLIMSHQKWTNLGVGLLSVYGEVMKGNGRYNKILYM